MALVSGTSLWVNLASLVVLIAGLRAAETVVLPILVAVFLAVISFPLVNWLCAKGIHLILAVSIVLLVGVLMVGALGLAVSQSVQSFTEKLPEYEEQLTGQVTDFRAWLQSTGTVGNLPSAKELVQTSSLVNITGRLVGALGLLLTNTLLILLCYVFLLLEAKSLPQRLKKAFGEDSNTLRDLRIIASKMNHYLVLKALVSLGTGVPVWLFLWVMGVDYPVLWGLLAFLLNFIPNIGSAIAAIPPVLLALVQSGLLTALGVAGFFVAINLIMGNMVEPRIMGKGLGLSTFVVVVALVFWGWVLGTVGMFLAIPLTIMVQIVLASSPDTHHLAILLGGDPDADDELSELRVHESGKTSEATT